MALPRGQLWRHNVAGDFSHREQTNVLSSLTYERINQSHLADIVEANKGKRGFTYTHHDCRELANWSAISNANKSGFTVNLSANNYAHADELKKLNCGPVVTVQSADSARVEYTPAGHKVVTCPAVYRDDVTCETCHLCQHVSRETIVGFPAHGMRKKAAQTASIQFVPKTW